MSGQPMAANTVLANNVPAITVPADPLSDPDDNGLEVAAEFELPTTGESRVDEALTLVSDLSSKTPAESATALREVLKRLDRILKDPQDS